MPDLNQMLHRAVAVYNNGKLTECEQMCRQILAARYDFFDAVHLLAVALAMQGKHEKALTMYDRAVALNPNHAEAFSNRGNTLNKLRRFDDALASFDRAIALMPEYVPAYSNRGAMLREMGRLEDAVASFDQALARDPSYFSAISNRAVTLHEMGHFEEALASFHRALALQPNSADLHANLGVTQHEMGRFPEALASYDRAIALNPNHADAHSNRGLTLQAMKRYPEALASYDRSLAIRADHPQTLSNRGTALHEMNRHEEALASYDRALALAPDYPDALSNRGLTLYKLKRYDEALTYYDRAIAQRPNYAEALCNRGATLRELKRCEEALESYNRAIALKPDYVDAFSNRGNTLHELKRFEEAIASFDTAIRLQPSYAKAHSNRGVTLNEIRRLDEAIASFENALRIQPDYADAHYNESLCLLLTSRLLRGWEEYEWRWKSEYAMEYKREFPQPLWLGEQDIKGKTLLVHAEQGFGDMLQFCRYVPLAAERGARVILEIPEALRDLMFSLAGSPMLVTKGTALPAFDLHCPMLSLPLAFKTQMETIPATVPYLQAAPQAIAEWDAKLGPRTRPRIGLVWSGSTQHRNDHNRSIPLSALQPLLQCNATFVSLQKEVRERDADTLRASGMLHFGDELKTFSDTAAVISNLDLVISVDTSVAHLAGALGRPLWILLPYTPDWRWLLDREDTPWYPTGRLFRQDAARTWDNVLPRLRAELEKFLMLPPVK